MTWLARSVASGNWQTYRPHWGSSGTMIPGGETAYAAWIEARSSFVHGNFVTTVMLCQGLTEHMLAAHVSLGLDRDELPSRIGFRDTLSRCLERGVIGEVDAHDLHRLMALRNPLSHYRSIDDPANLSRRTIETQIPAEQHLLDDATSPSARRSACWRFRRSG